MGYLYNIVTSRHVVNENAKYDSKPLSYPMHDLNSVFTHWDNKLKRNVPTENKINGGTENNAESEH